jgi:hypothetical protein
MLALTYGTDIAAGDEVKVIQNHKISIKIEVRNLGVTK